MRIYILFFFFITQNLPANPVRDFWFSGAEINRYELSQAMYGRQHAGHAEFIFVTEPLLVEEQVKHEYGKGPSTDVLKLNALRTFNTGIYSYRTMTSTFQPIDLKTYPHALKSNTSVQDWCGQTFQQFNRTAEGWRVELRSYFQGTGDKTHDLESAWLEDEIWVQLRLDPEKLPTGTLKMIPGAMYARLAHKPTAIETAKAHLSIKGKSSTYTLSYPELERKIVINFDTEFPHIIRKWEEHANGDVTRAVLTHRLMNQNYWSKNKPADTEKRKKIGLNPQPN